MAFDIEMIKKVYANFPSRVEAARKLLNRPLTLTEKFFTRTCTNRKGLKNFNAERAM